MKVDTISAVAPAKINLALHVRHRTAAGWHHLESLFVHTRDGDRITVAPADGLRLHLTGPEAAALGRRSDNIVLAAAAALQRAAGSDRGAIITLDKQLPVSSGIGGGSSDAATTLRLLASLWGIDPDAVPLHPIAAALGADVAPCLTDTPKRIDGRGDRFTPLDLPWLRDYPVLLVNPRVPVATAAVFQRWDGRDLGPLGECDGPIALRLARNDLTAAAAALAPAIDDVLAWLSAQAGASLVRMSGSGATCFALFANPTDRDRAATAGARDHADWWMMPTTLA